MEKSNQPQQTPENTGAKAEEQKPERSRIYFPATVQMELTYGKGWKKGRLMMTMEGASLTDPETKEEVAWINNDMGGGIVIHDKARDETWHMGPRAIWNAYQAMVAGLTEDDVKEPEIASPSANFTTSNTSQSESDKG